MVVIEQQSALLNAAVVSIRNQGFAVLLNHLNAQSLTRVRDAHQDWVATATPVDVFRSASGSNTRINLPVDHPMLAYLHLDPFLRMIAAEVIEGPFKLSGFLSRTVHSGAVEQPLHVDMARDGNRTNLVGFIYMLDDFRGDNGSTQFVAGSQRDFDTADAVMATGPGGSLLVYDGAILHSFSANATKTDRRSIQGAFICC